MTGKIVRTRLGAVAKLVSTGAYEVSRETLPPLAKRVSNSRLRVRQLRTTLLVTYPATSVPIRRQTDALSRVPRMEGRDLDPRRVARPRAFFIAIIKAQ